MFIQTEQTPNPQTLKFLPGKAVTREGSREFRDAEEGAASPLAADLFQIEGVARVFFGPDFVTVTKDGPLEWRQLKAPILAAIMDHYTSGRPLYAPGGPATATGHAEGVYDANVEQVVSEIKELLDTRIRPAVAQDGGDILFDRFDPESGVVFLNMRGSC